MYRTGAPPGNEAERRMAGRRGPGAGAGPARRRAGPGERARDGPGEGPEKGVKKRPERGAEQGPEQGARRPARRGGEKIFAPPEKPASTPVDTPRGSP